MSFNTIAVMRTASGAPAKKPRNLVALAQLHAEYAAYRQSGMGRRIVPWTKDAALALGKLFFVAYGVIPPASYLQGSYSMPEESTIQRLFGTLQEYRVAISEEVQDARV